MFKAHKAPIVFCIFFLSVLTSACGGEKKTVVKEVVDDATKSEVVALNAKVLQLESMLSQLDGRVEDIDLGLMDVEDQVANTSVDSPLLVIEETSGAVLGKVASVDVDSYIAYTSKGYYFKVSLTEGGILMYNHLYFASSDCTGTPHFLSVGTAKTGASQGIVFWAKGLGNRYFYSSPSEAIGNINSGSYLSHVGCYPFPSSSAGSVYWEALENDPAVTGFPDVFIDSIRVQ